MKAIFLTLLLFLPIISFAQVVRIPDKKFKEAVIALGHDTNDDEQIQVAEAKKVSVLNINSLGIVNMEGINSFTNLTELNLVDNRIISLDV